MTEQLYRYIDELYDALHGVEVTGPGPTLWDIPEALVRLGMMVRETHKSGNKTMLIGNGGSAAIASHIAIDYSKNGGWRAMAFNDSAALTCLSNDLGYEHVFAKQIWMHAAVSDLVILISSSGKSANILEACTAATLKGCEIVTFTGFDADNQLRRQGRLNFWVPSHEYGIVETAHQVLLHFIVSQEMGWAAAVEPPKPLRDPKIEYMAAAGKAIAARGRVADALPARRRKVRDPVKFRSI